MGRWKERALAGVGSVARHVPADRAQLFSFIASPSVRADPWSLYRRLHHRRGGVIEGPYGVWVVASHREVTRILREAPTTVDESQADLPDLGGGPSDFSDLIERTLLFTDPPAHTRVRRLVSRRFTPRTVEAMRAPVTDLAERSVRELRSRGSADLVADLAVPFPVAVIVELLGLPSADQDRFVAWAQAMAPRLDISLFRDEVVNERGDRAAREMVAYFGDLLEHPERCDPDGLLVALVGRDEEGEVLEREDLIALFGLLLLAGFETTSNLVTNSIHTLLSRPDDLAAIRDGAVDMGVAVDELLRHDGPVQLSQRVLLEPWPVGEHVLPARTLVALLIGAANRDPTVFADPDEIDLTRTPNPHLSFSSGIHHCLGAALARLEAAALLPAILRGLPDLELAGRPRRRDTFVLRGFTELPVRWRA